MQLRPAAWALHPTRSRASWKEIEGKLTGDPVRQAEGAVQSTAGKVVATVKAGARRVKAKAKLAKAAVSTKVGPQGDRGEGHALVIERRRLRRLRRARRRQQVAEVPRMGHELALGISADPIEPLPRTCPRRRSSRGYS